MVMLGSEDARAEATSPNKQAVYERIVALARDEPDLPAIASGDAEITYGELAERSDRLATFLGALGVGRNHIVGICLGRSVELIVASAAVHKAGAAVALLEPRDASRHLERVSAETGMQVLITERARVEQLPAWRLRTVCIDADWPAIAKHERAPRMLRSAPDDLACFNVTDDGGVRVTHRALNAALAALDPIRAEVPAVWELTEEGTLHAALVDALWALSYGSSLLLPAEARDAAQHAARANGALRPIAFSIFLWGSDDRESADKYRLMLDSARFADTHGFAAVWTPERHFHAFGGPYPNPAVTGAAIAATTSRVQVRAGSCVVPLHHPARIAEEWAIVDNLSRGRVGIGFASGWQPDDFLLRPESYPDFKRAMSDGIDAVRKLWRGEQVTFKGALGRDVAIVTQPRPVQHELPFWITSAGNPETYRLAGALGANVLTHLLGQSVDEVATKIRVYRQARAEAGFDPSTGVVSLMLHTFIGRDLDEVRDTVRGPLKRYLASAVALVKSYAWAFPAFKRPKGEEQQPRDIDLESLTAEETDAILEFAFQRYFESSGLFGTPESCQAMIDRCRAIGVDDIACLIDFGVTTSTVVEALEQLDAARALAQPAHALRAPSA